ncbi:MAG: endonuclease I family protein, partial [Pseudobdellovibrionaceae bacterium]
HHLYPTDSKLNSIRGNYPFGEVVRSKKALHCESGAMFGDPEQGSGPVFEPPAKHKGNVARALFYFSSKYHMAIDPAQEATLKKWHIEDPVDAEEMRRNEEIYKVQMSRNPFIDYPELASQISDF